MTEISLPSVYPFPGRAVPFALSRRTPSISFPRQATKMRPMRYRGSLFRIFPFFQSESWIFSRSLPFLETLSKGKPSSGFCPAPKRQRLSKIPKAGDDPFSSIKVTNPAVGIAGRRRLPFALGFLFVNESGEETPFSLPEGTIRYAFSDGETALLLVQNKEQTAFSSTHLYTLYRGTKDGFSLLTENAVFIRVQRLFQQTVSI